MTISHPMFHGVGKMVHLISTWLPRTHITHIVPCPANSGIFSLPSLNWSNSCIKIHCYQMGGGEGRGGIPQYILTLGVFP
jgi:hypothetical protein